MSSLGQRPSITKSQTPALKRDSSGPAGGSACESRFQRLVFNGNQVPGAVPQAVLTERRWRALNRLQRFNDGSNDAFCLLGQRRTTMMNCCVLAHFRSNLRGIRLHRLHCLAQMDRAMAAARAGHSADWPR